MFKFLFGKKPVVNASGRGSKAREVWGNFRKNKVAMICLVVLLLLLLMMLLADVIVPYDDAIRQDPNARLQPPSAEHWFGTDALGRDEFARIVHGAKYSVSIGIIITGISFVLGSLLGAIAGYYGGKIDDVIMRICDILQSIPGMLLMLSIVAALGPSFRNMIIAMTATTIPGQLRVVRASIITVSNEDYIEAARAYNCSDFRMMLRYIIPNALGPIIVTATMSVAGGIIGAAGMSFLGMGVQSPTPEWGAMLSEAKNYIRRAPYLMYIPGLAIMITCLAINLVGDGLRDALDPRLKD